MALTYTGKGGVPYLSEYDAEMSYHDSGSGQCQDSYGVYGSDRERAEAKWDREHDQYGNRK